MISFRRFNLINLGYTLLVIVWGAFVRATGSGAGCGDHWPLCNGEVVPQAESVKTMIEFAHRTSSGLSLVFVVAAYFWSRKVSEKNSLVRKVAFLSVIAIFLEAALGAGLVLLKLVEFDQSVMRAVSISLHLVNTLFLLGTLTTLCWLSNDQANYQNQSGATRVFPRDHVFQFVLGVFTLLGMAGAVTALGDTLFPAESLSQGFEQHFIESSHFLIKLQIIHPILAVIWVVLAFVWSRKLESRELMGVRAGVISVVILQFLIGFINWILMAPTYMQLIHLLVADLVFITFWLSGLKHEARKNSLTT